MQQISMVENKQAISLKDKKTALHGIGGEKVEKKRTFLEHRGGEEYFHG